MIILLYFVQGMALGLSASTAPGPFQAFLLAQTLKNGWQRTLPTALAPLVSDGPIIALVLMVLTRLPGWSMSGLQIAGGLFVLYLARGAFLALKQADAPPEVSGGSSGRGFLKGVLMNALSPGPYLFWSVVAGPKLLEGWGRSPALGFSFVLGFYGTLVGGFAGFIILFATASRLGPWFRKGLGVVSFLALLLFGLYQLWLGTASLLG